MTSVPSSGRPTCEIDAADLGNRGDDFAQLGRELGGGLHRGGAGQSRPDPEIALLERGHEFSAQVGDQEQRVDEQADHDREGQ